MRSRSRTQLPRKSVAWGASQSWPTWAPASDRPERAVLLDRAAWRPPRWSSLASTQRDPQRQVGLVEGQVEHGVEGLVAPGFGHLLERRRPASSGCAGSRRSSRCPSAERRTRVARRQLLRPAGAARPDRRRPARRSSTDRPIKAANTGLVLSGNGSATVYENVSGRGVTCGQTWAPWAQPSRLRSTRRLWVPAGDVSSAP